MKRTNPTLIAALIGVLVLLGLWAYKTLRPVPLQGTVIQQQPLIPEVSLTDLEGQEARLQDLSGIKLVFFGFTRCPDICPATMSILRRAYEGAGKPANVKVVLVTVDPENDTPQVLKRYIKHYHPDFVGFTGEPDQLALLANAFYVGFQQLSTGGFSHTDTVAVLDEQNRMRLVYNQQKLGQGLLDQDLPTLARGRFE